MEKPGAINPQMEKLRQLQSGGPAQAGGRNGQAPSGNQLRPGAGGYVGGPALPEGYLQNGYFDKAGNIRPELLLRHAEEVARAIGRNPGGIANAQLRKFYGHVRMADTRMSYDVPFEIVRGSVLELGSFVAEARGKNKVPEVFKQFIDRNLERIADGKDFRQGFVKHFQAVVGYFTFHYPRA